MHACRYRPWLKSSAVNLARAQTVGNKMVDFACSDKVCSIPNNVSVNGVPCVVPQTGVTFLQGASGCSLSARKGNSLGRLEHEERSDSITALTPHCALQHNVLKKRVPMHTANPYANK